MLQPQTNEFLKSQTGKMVLGLILGDGTIAKSRFEHTQRSLYWEYSRHISMQFQREFPNLLTPNLHNFYSNSPSKIFNRRNLLYWLCSIRNQ